MQRGKKYGYVGRLACPLMSCLELSFQNITIKLNNDMLLGGWTDTTIIYYLFISYLLIVAYIYF